MGRTRKDDGSKSDFNKYRLYELSSKVGKNVMYLVFCWGCPKPATMSLREFLVSRKGMSNNEFKRRFDKSQREKIDNDPSGCTYDVTLLFACIQVGCSDLVPVGNEAWITHDESKLEYFLQAIKNFRNEIAHSTGENMTQLEIFAKIEEIRIMFTKTIELAGLKYQQPQQEIESHVSHLNESLNDTRDTPLSPVDFRQYSQEILTQRSHLKKLVNSRGKDELKAAYSVESQIDPVSFISGGQNLEISSIFTRVEMVHDSQKDFRQEPTYENIFEITDSHRDKPSILLVEGVAGAGKTTLCKLILFSWSKESGLVHGLDQYDLLFHIKCHNSSISSFLSFLLTQLPKTSCLVKDEDLIRSVLNSNVLFLVDGLDEINRSSNKLLTELFQKHFKVSAGNIRILCTTRPERVDFMDKMVPSSIKMCHLRLNGISKDRRVEFVTKLDQEMRRIGLSHQNTNGLINFLTASTKLSEHFRFPLNLVLLTYLWAVHPDAVKLITSATSLYCIIMEMTQKKLIKRLSQRKGTQNLPENEIKRRCTKFLEAMYRESLLALRWDAVTLKKESIDRLVSVCKKLTLPSDDLFSASLTLTKSWTLSGVEEEVGFPHKGLQDFYASQSIILSIGKKDEKIVEPIKNDIHKILEARSIPIEIRADILQYVENQITTYQNEHKTILRVLQDLHQEDTEPLQLSKYHNTLIHLAGLLSKNGSDMVEQYAEEIVNLLVKSGVRDPEHWLNVVAEAECSPTMAKEVGKVIIPDRWKVRDGHLQAASILLRHSSVRHIELDIDSDPRKLLGFVEFLQQLSQYPCDVHLNLHQHWQHPELDYSDDFFDHLRSQHGQAGFQVSKVMGSVRNIVKLFPVVEVLYLGIGKYYGQNSLNTPYYLKKMVTKAENLYLHVVPEVPLQALTQLPDKRFPIDLWFSGVDDTNVDWVGQAALKLQPPNTFFWSIRFPRSQLTVKGCEALATCLKGVRLGIDGVHICSPNITATDAESLNLVFLNVLRGPMRVTDDVNIWKF